VAERRAERGKRNKMRSICSGMFFREYLGHIFLNWLPLFCLTLAGCLLGLLLKSIEQNKISLRNVAEHLPDHKASYPRKHYCGNPKFKIYMEFLKIADGRKLGIKLQFTVLGNKFEFEMC
jgi:hypothetical protein